jgi:hypothetical protein
MVYMSGTTGPPKIGLWNKICDSGCTTGLGHIPQRQHSACAYTSAPSKKSSRFSGAGFNENSSVPHMRVKHLDGFEGSECTRLVHSLDTGNHPG